MKKSHNICIENKFSEYIYTKELNLIKSKSKSPSLTTASDSPKSNDDTYFKKSRISEDHNESANIFVPILNIEDDPYSFESKTNLKDDIFSKTKTNHFFAMKLEKNESPLNPLLFNSDIKSNSYMKVRGKITVNNKISNLAETNIESNYFNSKLDKNSHLFENTIINTNLYDNFLKSISDSNSNSNSSSNIKSNTKNIDNENSNQKNVISNKNSENAKNSEDSILLNCLSEKEKIIISALSELKKDNIKNNKNEIDNLDIDLEDYYFNKKYKNIISSYSSEEDIEFEKNVYQLIDNKIKLFFKSVYNYDSQLQEKKSEIKKFNNEIKKILLYEEKIENFSCIGFKSIIMSLFSLIIDLLSHSSFKINLKRLKSSEKKILNFDNDKNLIIFIDLKEKYNRIKSICPLIEKDFKDIIESFQKQKKTKLNLSDLLTDLYWDHAFKNNNINTKFINGYSMDCSKSNINFEESKTAMDEIINILFSCNSPLKKEIGELLDLPYIKKENIYLMTYILKHRNQSKNFKVRPPIIVNNDENINTSNKMIINNDDENIDNNIDIKGNEEKNTENFSLEEVYNYIQGDNEQKSKKKSKKHRKRKKNKNDENKTKEKENINENIQIDPVVEEFRQYFIDFDKKNKNCVKIKPVLSNEWIKSLS